MTDNIASFPDLGSALTGKIINAAIEVHKSLGPGLLENVYEACLNAELEQSGIQVERQIVLPVYYKGLTIEQGFRMDLWVEKRVIIEVKACDKILPIHKAQISTYMRLSKSPLGLLINFNEKLLKNGIERIALTEFA